MAFQLLFSSEMNDLPAATLFDEGYYCEDIGLPCDFSRSLFVGASEHLTEIDRMIAETILGWQLNRLPLADKAILRLAIYEMLYVDDVPISVSINEAVDLAWDFGGADKSPSFVNGVLGRIANRLSDNQKSEANQVSDNNVDKTMGVS
jgi:N utilization substance protein B